MWRVLLFLFSLFCFAFVSIYLSVRLKLNKTAAKYGSKRNNILVFFKAPEFRVSTVTWQMSVGNPGVGSHSGSRISHPCSAGVCFTLPEDGESNERSATQRLCL